MATAASPLCHSGFLGIKVAEGLCQRAGVSAWPNARYFCFGLTPCPSPRPGTRQRSTERDSFWREFGMDFFSAREEIAPCELCGRLDDDGHLFSECSDRPLVLPRESLEFASLMALDESRWPRCLRWHGAYLAQASFTRTLCVC